MAETATKIHHQGTKHTKEDTKNNVGRSINSDLVLFDFLSELSERIFCKSLSLAGAQGS